MDGKSIGARIRRMRRMRDMTQEQLAEAADMSVHYLSNIETGYDICGTQRLLAIANALEASMDYLLADNLVYNQKAQTQDVNEALLAEIAHMDEAGQKHLLRYVRFMREEEQVH